MAILTLIPDRAWVFSDDDEALSHLQVALQPADAVIVSPVNLGGANTGLQMWFVVWFFSLGISDYLLEILQGY